MPDTASSPKPAVSLRLGRLLACTFGHGLSDGYANFVPPLWFTVQQMFSLSDPALGLVSQVLGITTNFAQPVFGYVVDRYRLRNMIPLALLLATLFMSLVGFAPNLTLFLVCMMLSGLALLLIALWLLRYDIARRRIKAGGQARFGVEAVPDRGLVAAVDQVCWPGVFGGNRRIGGGEAGGLAPASQVRDREPVQRFERMTGDRIGRRLVEAVGEGRLDRVGLQRVYVAARDQARRCAGGARHEDRRIAAAGHAQRDPAVTAGQVDPGRSQRRRGPGRPPT